MRRPGIGNEVEMVFGRVFAGNLLSHDTIQYNKYKAPSLHTAIKMLSGNQLSNWCGRDLGSDPNGTVTYVNSPHSNVAAINQMVQNHPLKA